MSDRDYIELGTVTALDLFNKQLAKVSMEFVKNHKPFDEPCARLEFKDKLDNAEKESVRRFGFIKHDEIKIEVGDLYKYGEDSRFETLEDQEDYVDKVMEGSRTQVIVGHTLSYRCKARGHGISVFIPIHEYNQMNEVKPEPVEVKPKSKK